MSKLKKGLRVWIKSLKKMDFPTTLEFEDGKLSYVCFDYEEFGYALSDVICMKNTGFLDIDCDYIYEGDVVENSYVDDNGYYQSYTFTVVWVNGAFRRSDRLDETLYDELEDDFASNHKVIGNIHENPELVE